DWQNWRTNRKFVAQDFRDHPDFWKAFYGDRFASYTPVSEKDGDGEAMRLLVVSEAQSLKNSPVGTIRVLDPNTLQPMDASAAIQAQAATKQLSTTDWQNWRTNRKFVAQDFRDHPDFWKAFYGDRFASYTPVSEKDGDGEAMR